MWHELMPIILAHVDPCVRSTLAASLQSVGLATVILPEQPEALQAALSTKNGGTAVLDIDLVPAALPVLRRAAFHLVAVTLVQNDPRTAKLEQWGAKVLPAAEVPGYLSEMTQTGMGEASPTASIPLEPTGARITVLHSPKGGAGTSTLAAHLATTWALQGQSIALVDLAPYGASAMLCKVQQQAAGFEALIAALEADPNLLERPDLDLTAYLTPLLQQPGRLDLLTGGRPRHVDRLDAEGIGLLLKRLSQLPYDQIIVDTSAEPTPRNLEAMAAAFRLLLVATPEYAAGWNLIQLQEMLDVVMPGAERVVVLNRSSAGTGLTAANLQARLGLPVVVTIPEDGYVQRLGNDGVPWDLQAESAFGVAIHTLAEALRYEEAGLYEQA